MDIEVLLSSSNPLIAVETIEEERLQELIQHLAWRLNLPVFTWDCNQGLGRLGQGSPIYQTKEPIAALTSVAEMESGIFFFKDLYHYLDDPKVRRMLRDVSQRFSNQKTIVFVSSAREYPAELKEILVICPLPLPTKEQLGGLLNQFLAASQQVKNALTAEETNQVLENLRGLTAFEAKRALSQAVVSDRVLDGKDIKLLAGFKKKFVEKDNLVSYISPEDNLDTIGGLAGLKDWIAKRKAALAQKDLGLPAPKGILLTGVPGCGKTLSARAIAHELGIGLMKLDPGRLYNKYIGESEANLRRVLDLAESLAPIVLLIDEVEKVLPSGTDSAADGGLSLRLFGTFLSWLQDKEAPVFVVATSNNIAALPPEFSRKGRFDEVFFVDLPDAADRRAVFEIHLRKRQIDQAAVDIDELVRLTDGFSGAEIEELIVSSLYSVASGAGVISTDIIKAEIAKTVPLSRRESEQIAALRQWAAQNTVKA